MAVDTGNKKAPEEYIPEILDQSNTEDPVNKERRSVLRKLAVGTAVLAGCSVLPEKWTTPLVEFGTLPAHATTSGEDEEEAAEEEEKVEEEEAAEEDDMHGYDNELTIKNKGDKVSVDRILQDKFVFPKLGPKYGKSFLIVWSDENELLVPDSKHMILKSAPDARKYQPGYPYSSNREIRTMEVYAKRGTHPESVTLFY